MGRRENATSACSIDLNNTKKDIFVYPLEVIESCGLPYRVLCEGARSQCPTPYLFVYQFEKKRHFFSVPLNYKKTPPVLPFKILSYSAVQAY